MKTRRHFAFIFGWDGMIPPTADNVKAYFVSKELIDRGQRVTWTRYSHEDACRTTREGIAIKDLRPLALPKLHRLSFLARVFSFCLREKVNAVYLDCWFFTRSDVHLLLFFQAMMKAIGTRILYDARDPFPEYEIACGKLREGTFKARLYRVLSCMLYKQSDVILVTSNEFKKYLERVYAVRPSKVHAIYHGADVETFNLGSSGRRVREKFGLRDKLVVGLE